MSLDAARKAGQQTADRGDKVAAAASAAVVAMLSAVGTAAAISAAQQAKTDSGLGVGEQAADAAAVRQAMAGTISNAATALAQQVYGLLMEAIADGWDAGAQEQDAMVQGIRIKSERLPDSALVAVPIQGHSSREIAMHQAAVWQFAAEGVLGQSGAMGDPATIPPGLALAASAAGNRAGQAVGDAFAVGASLARQAVGQALARG